MDKLIKGLRIVLIGFFALWVVVWFSIRAFKLKEIEGKDIGLLGSLVTGLHETPYLIKKYFKRSLQAVEIDKKDNLFEIGKLSHLDNVSDSIYILHNKYIDENTANVLLQNIKTGDIAFSWTIPLDMVMSDLDLIREDLTKKSLEGLGPKKLNVLIPKSPDNIIIRHPLFLKDGSLIFKPQYLGYIYKIDKNSKLLWKSKKLAHHSVELDENENIWTCSMDVLNETSNKLDYRDDAVLCLDQNGNEKYFMSLTEIFQENDIFKKVIEATPVHKNEAGSDPYHLNDIQPVKVNGTYWKKGDIFISLRHKSLIALYRPESDKIIWLQQGPWSMQHDVNIENDSVISFFNNNVSFINNKINTTSKLSKYNFKNNSVKFFADNIFSSKTEGRQTRLPNGDILVESTNEAIYYLLDTIGIFKSKFYVSFIPDPKYAQYPGWARVYLKEGKKFREQ